MGGEKLISGETVREECGAWWRGGGRNPKKQPSGVGVEKADREEVSEAVCGDAQASGFSQAKGLNVLSAEQVIDLAARDSESTGCFRNC